MEIADEYERDAEKNFLLRLRHTSQGTLHEATMTVEPATWHIFQTCRELMSEDERATAHYLAMLQYAYSFTVKRERIKGENRAKRLLQPAIEEMLKDGDSAFLARVKDRLLQKHGQKLLNLCPKCGALARTPQSRQCSKCLHSWHDA
ncbi:hypothetical protein CCAX7_60880 [Capsulimonas corticalis]|uniref:Uncharacterized protein n=1 Tax=Capsulimonas corticalis TaxID=2219043 RepID=A0A402CW41_9BACT|nr:hypothetical protein [Capsulimonas corticalis]BDI34037.1 hypothetical protein CCAX7_60880 [Capsulimonas corticalis]